MRWLYRLQQRLSLTRQESFALLGLAFLLATGLTARLVFVRWLAPAPGPLEANTSLFEEGARRYRSQTTAPPDAAPSMAPPVAPAPGTGRINLNTATAEELERLPRIGPAMAARIIAYREEHGPFARVADLTRVRGIGPKTLAQLEPLLYVEDDP
ncbi:MAG: helix-hairpin-helix domain-containing protein [Bacteroidetes bacterium]|nr:MAG: helix-hairpin-helix domain-containing protein [Bacteroidota bacterium]GIV57197.1 MAG: hypothetical protein KatS3mg042_0110 [Rhodothermaceae bacterium]